MLEVLLKKCFKRCTIQFYLVNHPTFLDVSLCGGLRPHKKSQATPIVNGDRRPSEKNGLTFNPKKRRSEG